ncbi:39S ribosomal protein L47, mitochondrial [Physocladia obscura]|uniref:Large ribosomal subunit protein uL29m n=1 Tax=Physocladia obscura TaxID=109957 RepID=A0AAD5SX96_9FUNG|nr:39S ribosomal protein L47, mitochondrial [Physocladia obscura]
MFLSRFAGTAPTATAAVVLPRAILRMAYSRVVFSGVFQSRFYSTPSNATDESSKSKTVENSTPPLPASSLFDKFARPANALSNKQVYPAMTPIADSVKNSTETSNGRGLLDFFDNEQGWYWSESDPKTGRAWTCAELRPKSFDDLHKLWWICVKEQNKLLSQKDEARLFKILFPNTIRLQQVRYTMRAIKAVIHERRIAYLQAQAIVERESKRQEIFNAHVTAYKKANNIAEGKFVTKIQHIHEKVDEIIKRMYPVPVHEVGRKTEERRRIDKALQNTTNGRKKREANKNAEKREKIKGSRWFVV